MKQEMKQILWIVSAVWVLVGCGGGGSSSDTTSASTADAAPEAPFNERILGTWYWRAPCVENADGSSQQATLTVTAQRMTTETIVYSTPGCTEEYLVSPVGIEGEEPIARSAPSNVVWHEIMSATYTIGEPYTAPSGISGYKIDFGEFTTTYVVGSGLGIPPAQYTIVTIDASGRLVFGKTAPFGSDTVPSGYTPDERAVEFDFDNNVWVRGE